MADFRKINESETIKLQKKVKNDEKTLETLESTVQAQKRELMKTKQRKDIFEIEELKELMRDFENEDWTKNVTLYGKYISILKFDNSEKDELINLLRTEVKKLRDQNINDVGKISKNAGTDLPLPGEQFLILPDSQKVNIYARAFQIVQRNKKEIEKLCHQQNIEKQKGDKILKRLKKGHETVLTTLRNQIEVFKGKKDMEEEYMEAAERAALLEKEVSLQSQYLSSQLAEKQKEVTQALSKVDQITKGEASLRTEIDALKKRLEGRSQELQILQHKFKRRFLCTSCWKEQGIDLKDPKNHSNYKPEGGVVTSPEPRRELRRKSSSSSSNQKNRFKIRSKSKLKNPNPSNSTSTKDNTTTPKNTFPGQGQENLLNRADINSKIRTKKPSSAINIYESYLKLSKEGQFSRILSSINGHLRSGDMRTRETMTAICARKHVELGISAVEMDKLNIHIPLVNHIASCKVTQDLRYPFYTLSMLLQGVKHFPSFQELEFKGYDWDLFFRLMRVRLVKTKDSQEVYSILNILSIFAQNSWKIDKIFNNKELFQQVSRQLLSSK